MAQKLALPARRLIAEQRQQGHSGALWLNNTGKTGLPIDFFYHARRKNML